MNMAFYEIEHGANTNHFLYEQNTDHSFPPHIHRCYEMVLMLEGEMHMQVGKRLYTLREGDLILVKPHRVHSYHTADGSHSRCLLCVFSGDLIAAINEPLSKYRLRSEVLHDTPTGYAELFESLQDNRDLPTVKGFLYLLCALFYRELDEDQVDVDLEDGDICQAMLAYAEKNKDKSCTLHELAKELTYNESHLSRIFMRNVGVSFSDYVRNIKVNTACHLLKNTDESVFLISVKCGYTTQSSFNRSFKQITGVTPNQYRAQKDRQDLR